jgi:hypothetical protein
MAAILIAGEARDSVTLRNVADFVPFVHGRDDRIRRYPALPDPRLFRNENPQYADLYPRTVYLVRDPRAALVSFWRMYQVIFGSPSVGLEPFIDQYMSMNGIFDTWNSKLERWDRQVGRYLERSRTDPRILIVRYEDMVSDRRDSLARVAGFLEFPASDSEIDLAVLRGGFDAMRQVEDRFGAEAYEGKARGKGKFVRVGRIDLWHEEMAPSVASRIEETFGPVMEAAGYL